MYGTIIECILLKTLALLPDTTTHGSRFCFGIHCYSTTAILQPYYYLTTTILLPYLTTILLLYYNPTLLLYYNPTLLYYYTTTKILRLLF